MKEERQFVDVVETTTQPAAVLTIEDSSDEVDEVEDDAASFRTVSPTNVRKSDGKISEEEIQALKQEGLDVTEFLKTKSFTKAQERQLKRIRRKIRNKKSAHESRRRKKEFMENLQVQFEEVKQENANLKQRINALESQNTQLKTSVNKLKAFIAAASQRTAQATTCVMLLVLSLAFFLAPSYGPLSIFNPKNNQNGGDTSVSEDSADNTRFDGTVDGQPAPIFVSRRILQLTDENGVPLDEPIINEPDFYNGSKKRKIVKEEIDELKRVKLERDVSSFESPEEILQKIKYDKVGGGRVLQLSSNLTQVLRHRQKQENQGSTDSHTSLMPQAPDVYRHSMKTVASLI